jgi:streptomycin 6-kinase
MFDPYLDRWALAADGEPIITHSSRLLPVLWQDKPAMLKIAVGAEEKFGGRLMRWWNGEGAAKIYDHIDEALLIERARGKRSLLTMAMNGEDDEASRIICQTVEKLHTPRGKPLPELVPLDRWFRELAPAARTHGGILGDCSAIADTLLAAPRDTCVLHGDIHHSNILDFGRSGWLAIDPKGLCGERGFDYANTFCNPDLPTVTAACRLQRQLAVVSAAAEIEPKRLLHWIIAYAGLSSAWFLADGASPENTLTVAKLALAELGRT